VSVAGFRMNLDRYSTTRTVLELRFQSHQVGDLPHVADKIMMRGIAPLILVPAEADVVGTYQSSSCAVALAEGPGYMLYLEAWANMTHVYVAATSYALAVEVLDRLVDPPEQTGDQTGVSVALWRHKNSGGGSRSDHTVQAKSWAEINGNYPGSVRTQLDHLVQRVEVAEGEGRLILFHGEPGVGKTTAIRALMHEWSPWCETHLITDPDRLFSESDYLMNILESGEGRSAPTLERPPEETKWKLIVAEDSDAYLRSTARLDAGAALGRLLNTTDGLLGQSTKALVLLTTNEELTRLHPALVRPGRCLARTEFVRFSRQEASEWLGEAGGSSISRTATLAELFLARREGGALVGSTLSTGTYL